MMKLSVIVAAYNAEKYIERCIDAIISQNADVEIVVVNDGSTDKTADILKKYADKIKHITLKQNGGSAAAARNIGLENASGDFITFCDSDDWYMPGAINKIIKLQNETHADIIRFSYTSIFSDGRTMPADIIFEDEFVEKCDFKEKVYPHFINGIGLNSVWASCFKREVIENLRFMTELQTAEDVSFSIEAYTNANNVLFSSEPLYCYYQHGDSITGSGLSLYKKYKCNFQFALKTLRFLPKWEMNTVLWRVRTILRPIRITLNKIKRLKKGKKDVIKNTEN